MVDTGEQWLCNLFLGANHTNENIGGWLIWKLSHCFQRNQDGLCCHLKCRKERQKLTLRDGAMLLRHFCLHSTNVAVVHYPLCCRDLSITKAQNKLCFNCVFRISPGENHEYQNIFMSKDWPYICFVTFLKSILLFTSEGEIKQRFTEKMSIYQERNSKISFGHNLEIKSSIKRRWFSSVHLFHRRAQAWLSAPWYPQQATDASDKGLYETVAGANFGI